jgi:Helix-hairpin-helix motif
VRKLPLGRLEINTAPEKELKMIRGVGPVMAAQIIAARPFRSFDDLKNVNGIGEKRGDHPALFSVTLAVDFGAHRAPLQQATDKKARAREDSNH